MKLAAHLQPQARDFVRSSDRRSAVAGRRVLYIFDEPTTGLHFDDVSKLLTAFRKLIDAGGSHPGDRAQPRRDQDGRLGDRSGPGGRRPRRAGGGRRPARSDRAQRQSRTPESGWRASYRRTETLDRDRPPTSLGRAGAAQERMAANSLILLLCLACAGSALAQESKPTVRHHRVTEDLRGAGRGARRSGHRQEGLRHRREGAEAGRRTTNPRITVPGIDLGVGLQRDQPHYRRDRRLSQVDRRHSHAVRIEFQPGSAAGARRRSRGRQVSCAPPPS